MKAQSSQGMSADISERISLERPPASDAFISIVLAPDKENVSVAKTAFARWIILSGLTLAVFMDALNGTIFSIARPQIMGAVSATPDEVSWINLGYLIAKVAFLLAAAWLVDRFGETPNLFWSVSLVAMASIPCAMNVELEAFVFARVAQGAAGAVLLVSAQAILFRLFRKQQQGVIQAFYALGVVMAPTTLAPAVQGWFTDQFSWTWTFWLNLLICAVVMLFLIPYRSCLPRTSRKCPQFDWIGFMLIGLAAASLVYVCLEGPRWNWFDDGHILLWTSIGLGALALVIFWRVLGQNRSQIFERQVFTNAQFAFGFLVSFIAGFALFGSAFLFPAFALGVLRMPPQDAGFLLLPSSLSVGSGLLAAGALVTWKNVNPFKFVPLGVVLVMTAMWMLSWSSLESGGHDLWLGLLLRGFGLGFLFLAVTLIALDRLNNRHLASGIGLFNFGRQMGGIIGISFLSTYLNNQVALNRRILIENINPANLPFRERQGILAQALQNHGLNPGSVVEGTATLIQKTIQAQVAALSFNEAFFSLVLL
ncbi:MAG: DHA2 family efflux MFS transporter permease subunit, partial [Roseibium sp.]|uniref:DHA2 family efflux MFS transporter permease subunit n=1 Tax=Roseibium sp. TaxID=1936156 RepID=UPI0026178466